MIEQEMTDINALMTDDMQTNAAYLRQIVSYLVIRKETPLHLKILLLSIKAVNYQGQSHLLLGVILDYIFVATALHDDQMIQSVNCQDEVLSQGIKGLYSRILVGDFFYSRAFNLMAKLGEMKVVSHLSNAINKYSEGQCFQISQAMDLNTTEDMYFQRLAKKSQLHFSCITQLVTILGECSGAESKKLGDYGFHLGSAVQIMEETISCIRGNAIDKNKPLNMPLLIIRGFEVATPLLHQLIEDSIVDKVLDPVIIDQICKQTDALIYTRIRIDLELQLAKNALSILPESIYRDGLADLTANLLAKFDKDLVRLRC